MSDRIKHILQLSLPIVLSMIGIMFMQFVDLIFLARYSSVATAGVGAASSIFILFFMFCVGSISGLDAYCSQYFGANNFSKAQHYLSQSVWIGFLFSIPFLLLLICFGNQLIDSLNLVNEILPATKISLFYHALGLPFLILFQSLKNFFQSFEKIKPVLISLFLANILNAILNYILIFGHFGFPELGVEGSSIATLASRVLLFFTLFFYFKYCFIKKVILNFFPHHFEITTLKNLLKIGFPASFQLMGEVGLFAATSILASKLSAIESAAHQIVLNIASLSFMVPLGLSIAGSVLVGQNLGSNKPLEARKVGNIIILLSIFVMSLSCIIFFIFPHGLLFLYTNNREIIKVAITPLLLATLFQLFDGTQVALVGLLRGAGETKKPAILNLIGYWIVALPIAYYLCFELNYRLSGLWIGLAIGLAISAISLLVIWIKLPLKKII